MIVDVVIGGLAVIAVVLIVALLAYSLSPSVPPTEGDKHASDLEEDGFQRWFEQNRNGVIWTVIAILSAPIITALAIATLWAIRLLGASLGLWHPAFDH